MTTNPLVERMQSFGTTIFAEMSSLAVATESVNLGQGMPDTDGPLEVAEAAIAAIRDGKNQYPPLIGVPELRHAVAEHQKRFYALDFDPDTEVLATAGATEAIAATMLALCEPGDEVVLFEPYYDSYAATVALAGASRKVVPLRPDAEGRYEFDPAELRAAISDRTKAILFNTPHNPTGKVFTAEETAFVAALCIEHDLIAITDEVYEHLVFDGRVHRPLVAEPGMRERTVQISSGGKTFSYTGWKIGWVCSTPELISAVRTAKQFLTYVNGGPFQYAIAHGLRMPDAYFAAFVEDMQAKRDMLVAGLTDAGFDVFVPEGTYFVTADAAPIVGHDDFDGLDFARSLPERCGVVAVPNVVFYDNKELGRTLLRFAFCKQVPLLEEGVRRLRTMGAS
ncbi:MAG: pyridoxal phosphate-dependent aminotransferase [Acidimicrobiales bacterium]|nr:pyridoxal phosphate-dependent aminotransferase [Acidimicrobiales bacterium]